MARSLAEAYEAALARQGRRPRAPALGAKHAAGPTPPDAIARRYGAQLAEFSSRVAARVELWVQGGMLADQLSLLEADLVQLAASYEHAGRVAARAVALQSRREVERMLDLKRIRGHSAGEQAFIDAFGRHQVDLLRNISVAQVKRIREKSVEGADAVRHALWVSRNRAQQVAHNETHALGTDVVVYWSQQAGEDEFYWLTARDERVRPGHSVLDGRRFRFDEPPNTGRREGHNLPGHAPHCRCRAVPLGAFHVR